MARAKRQGPKKKELMVRLDPDKWELARAVSRVTDTPLQQLFEPVINDWLREEWEEHPAIEAFERSKRLARGAEDSARAGQGNRPGRPRRRKAADGAS